VSKKYFPKNAIRNRTELVDFLEKVQKVNPNCVALKVVLPFCKVVDRKKNFPFLLTNLYREENQTKSLDELRKMGKRLY